MGEPLIAFTIAAAWAMAVVYLAFTAGWKSGFRAGQKTAGVGRIVINNASAKPRPHGQGETE